MPSSTTEDYLKAVFFGVRDKREGIAKTAGVASSLKVTAGTATVMLKQMAKEGYLEYLPRRGCRLTEKGSDIVLRIIRKHRLIEFFLTEVLHFDWSEVHEEAEIMEHCFSEKVINRLDEILGYPKTDPHGDIIPGMNARGHYKMGQLDSKDKPLADAMEKKIYRISRITNQDPLFLVELKKSGLLPGTRIQIVLFEPVLAQMTVMLIGSIKTIHISTHVAQYIRIREENGSYL